MYVQLQRAKQKMLAGDFEGISMYFSASRLTEEACTSNHSRHGRYDGHPMQKVQTKLCEFFC